MRFLPALLAFAALAVNAGEIDQSRALRSLQQPEALLIDVRSPEEFASGALPKATRVDFADIASEIGEIAPNKDTPIVLYCRSGRRSSIAQDTLQVLGYRQVVNAGGYQSFKQALKQTKD
jgi:phage shock protein E